MPHQYRGAPPRICSPLVVMCLPKKCPRLKKATLPKVTHPLQGQSPSNDRSIGRVHRLSAPYFNSAFRTAVDSVSGPGAHTDLFVATGFLSAALANLFSSFLHRQRSFLNNTNNLTACACPSQGQKQSWIIIETLVDFL